MFDAFGNATQAPPTNWRSEPLTRGTWNILSSCLVTLVLCLWTALHLNIPRHKEGVLRPKLRKIGWLVLGLLAPEMIAYTAWSQRRAAYKLDAVVRGKLGQRPSRTRTQRLAHWFLRCCHRRDYRAVHRRTEDVELDNSTSVGRRRHPWTTMHSFYVVMGGFVFDTGDADINFLPNNRQRLTLTPRGLTYLLDHEPTLVPNMAHEAISDKSKASDLAKTLVCIQATWFCVQCIVRCGQGLAVSLLELNVFGHAVCALLMYYFWWDKPLDIEEPTVMGGDMVNEMCALMCMRSTADGLQNKWTELPHGIRYGDRMTRNIVDTSLPAEVDGESTFWRGRGGTFSAVVSSLFSSDWAQRQTLDVPGRSDCRLSWTRTLSVAEQVEKTDQKDDYAIVVPLSLEYPRDILIGHNSPTKDSATASAATVIVADADDDASHTRPSAESQRGVDQLSESSSSTCDIDGLRLTVGEWAWEGRFTPRRPRPDYTPMSVNLDRADVVRWRLCVRALRHYIPGDPPWRDQAGFQEFPAGRCVYDRSPNWPSSEHLRFKQDDDSTERSVLFGFLVAGLVYGGLHLLAWNAPFRSHLEALLWRGSALLLASSGLITVVDPFFRMLLRIGETPVGAYLSTLADLIGDEVVSFLLSMAGVIFFSLLFLFAVAYVGARAYLVVESYLQIWHLPDSAYTVSSWSQYYPHIT